MDQLVARLKALGDENRFRIMMMLRERPLCSCEMLEVLDIAGGTLSAHLKILKEAGLLSQDKKGRWIQCSIASDDSRSLLDFLAGRIVTTDVFDSDTEFVRSRPPAADAGCTLPSGT